MGFKKMIEFINTCIPFLNNYPSFVHVMVAAWLILTCAIIIAFLFARQTSNAPKPNDPVSKAASSQGNHSPAVVTGDNSTVNIVTNIDLKKEDLLNSMKHIELNRHEKLIQQYPQGYALFMIHHRETVIPYKSRLNFKCKLDWSNAKICAFNNEGILIELPDIICDPGPVLVGCRHGLRREIGKPVRVFGKLATINVQMYLEILEDSNERIICVLGFADK